MKGGSSFFFTLVFSLWSLVERCAGHNRFWSNDQTIWMYLSERSNIVEFPMEEEYLIDNLQAYYDKREMTKQKWIEQVSETRKLNDGREILVNGGNTKKTDLSHTPIITIEVNDPMNNATGMMELSDKFTGVTFSLPGC
jgi:hypothetical protein